MGGRCRREIDPNSPRTSALEDLFRSRKEWREFCDSVVSIRRVCEICGKDLSKRFVRGKHKGKFCKRFNIHHRIDCQTMGQYMDLNPERFLLLCPDCHQWVHRICNSPNFRDKQWFVKLDENV